MESSNVIPFPVSAERRRGKQFVVDALATAQAKLRLTTLAWVLTLLRDAPQTLRAGILSHEIEGRLRRGTSLGYAIELLRKARLAMPKGGERENIEYFFYITKLSKTPGADVRVRLD